MWRCVSVRVCVCACVCVRACVCVCKHVGIGVSVYMCVHIALFRTPGYFGLYATLYRALFLARPCENIYVCELVSAKL